MKKTTIYKVKFCDTTDRKPVRPVVTYLRRHFTAIEVQVERSTRRRCTTPIVTVRTDIVQRAIIVTVPCGRQKQSV